MEPMVTIKTLLVTAVAAVVLTGCGDGDVVVTTVDTAPIVADLPVMDGSSSTLPLRMFVVCELLGTPCSWETILDGSRRVLPSQEALFETINAAIDASGTHRSYVALAEGRADMILTARAPTDEEVELGRDVGVEFEISPIALDGFVFLVNSTNPVESLTLDQVRGIFSGAITNWAQVGGEDRPIQPYQRNETSGSQVLMEKLVMRGQSMVDAPNMMLPSMMAPFDAISRDVDGIGYSVYYYATHILLNDDIRLIRIDGIEPNTATIRSGEYPLVSEVYAVLSAAAPGDDGARLLRDWLATDAGRDTIEASGYVAIR